MAAESAVRIIFLGDSAQAVRSVSRLEGAFGGLGRTSKIVAGALGVALVGGLVAATKAAIDFQHQMELIHTQAGASTKEVERMSKAILGLAASVGTGPEELAKGLFHIESAGIRGAHALQILKAAAEGAKVGHADLEATVNTLIGAFKSGVKGAGSMQHAMAVLNATVGAGNMRMTDLTAAMSTGLLSAARGVGISIQDVGAALAELTIQGQGATDSATRLQMAFLTMAANTTKGSAALKTIGISQNQLADDMRSHGLIFALGDLNQHLKDSGKTATEQTAIIADVFGRRSLKAIEPLLQHLDDVRKRQEQINQTTGNFGNAWVATQQTVSFQLDRAKAALQAAFIPIGTLLLPLVSRLAQGVGSAAQFITRNMGTIQAAAGAAARAIGESWNRYATPALHAFADEARHMAQVVQQNWPQIRGQSAATARSMQAAMESIGHAIRDLAPVAKALGPEFKVAFGLALLAARTFADQVRVAMRVVAAAVHIIAPALAYMVNSINKAVSESVRAFHAMSSGVSASLNAIVGPIQSVIHWIQSLVGWINKIPRFVHTVFSSTGSAGPPGGPRGGGPPHHAAGGFVAGQSGSPQMIIAHAGEVILNPMQQAAFGGAAFFKEMFGFTEGGSSFAAGGIVGRKPRRSPHRPRSPRYKAKNKLAQQALQAVSNINQTEDDTDRSYGQLVRQYNISDTDLQFIRTDDQGNSYISQPDIDQRVGEIDALIAARNQMLALLDKEKIELEKAIKDLQSAIKAMLAQIQAERKAIKELAAKMSAEKKKKKPNQGLINSWQNQISTHGTRIGNLQNTIGDFKQAIGDQQLNLNHQLPFDVRDVQLDIMDLQQERKDDLGTTLSAGSGGGGGGGGGGAGDTTGGVDIAALLAEIAKLKQALQIQGAQQAIIGSFQKGVLSVPETGLALVHAGEQIVPRGQVRGGVGVAQAPTQINVYVDDAMAWLKPYIRAEAVNASDQISVRIGQRATERARSGRF